jgi:type I restriction enzyme M protein
MAKIKSEEPIEKVLWAAANKLRKNIDAAEYKHVVLGLIFLRYISDAFEHLYQQLQEGKGEYAGADPEDKDEYRAENVFFVPALARWNYLKDNARHPEIGKMVDAAMDAIESENTPLKGVLPKVYAKGNLDVNNLGGLIDLISNISLGESKERTEDLLGHVFEYFLGEFALAEGKQGGQFYTPKSVVELLVAMLEPYKGRVMDPCCGSGGMFVQSEKFVVEHQGRMSDISIYGQESNQTTWRLAKMNLAIRGIDSSQVKWNNEGSFLKNEHKDVRVDYIIANPPFNDDDWSGELLRNDARWAYGIPPTGNANYAWIQHFLYHLAPSGQAGFVLSKGSLTTKTSGEDAIRQRLIEEGFIDCIVNLPAKLFLNTQIPACLWFMSRNRTNGKYRNRKREILFIDARKLGHLISRKNLELSNEDVQKIADTYHQWRSVNGQYADIPGFCASASIERVKELDYVLTPGRYVGLPDDEDDFNFKERFTTLKAELEKQIQEEAELNQRISENLEKLLIDE